MLAAAVHTCIHDVIRVTVMLPYVRLADIIRHTIYIYGAHTSSEVIYVCALMQHCIHSASFHIYISKIEKSKQNQ